MHPAVRRLPSTNNIGEGTASDGIGLSIWPSGVCTIFGNMSGDDGSINFAEKRVEHPHAYDS